MRLILIGQAAFGARVLEALVGEGEEIVGAFTPPGERGDPVAGAAARFDIPAFRPQRLRSPEVAARIKELAPDLGVMAFVTDIVPGEVLRLPRQGTIQYHPSLLPRHRGASAINWAIIMGETRTGLTIFYPDEGIDTGPILLQKEVEIDPDDTVGSLYFNKLFPLGVEAMVEAVRLIREGRAPRIPQDESQATYEEPCREKHALIDWSRPVAEVYNLIRGTNPQPGAYTFHRGSRLKIFDCRRVDGETGRAPGEVVEVAEDRFLVAAPGGAIRVLRVQPEGAAKMAASEYIKTSGLRPGERLG